MKEKIHCMHTMRRSLVVGAATLVASLALPAHAHGFRAGELVIDHPYATPSLAGTSNGAAYFRGIRNKGKAVDRLIGASTAVAGRVELHEMTMEGDVMKMAPVEGGLAIPAGGTVALEPMGYHLMFMQLQMPFKQGECVEVVLHFANAGDLPIELNIGSLSQAGPVMDHDMGEMSGMSHDMSEMSHE